jgi:hypothetical protein
MHSEVVIKQVGRQKQKNTFFEGNGTVGVDALRQSRQRHPGGELLCVRRQCNVSHFTLRSDLYFTITLRCVGLRILNSHPGVVANCEYT